MEQFEALEARFHEASIGSLRDIADVGSARSAMRDYDVLYSHTSIPGQIIGDTAARVVRRAHVIHQHTVPRVSPSQVIGTAHRALYRVTVALRHDGVRVGMLARFDPQKGHDVFLQMAAAMRDTGATFVLGASGSAYTEYERSIRSEAAALGVTIVDPGDESASFLAGLDIVVMPSLRAEGLPLTLLEAMALHKAIVASNVDGIGSIPGIAEAALLVTAGDVTATAATTRDLIDDPSKRAALGTAGSMLVEKRYRADAAARAAADIVERSTT
jgi:glycosyltransferase involved in cell wall biosynthesis